MKSSAIEETLALHIRAAKLPEPLREYRFHPSRKWRFDFAWPEKMLAVEVEGGVWSGGRHTRPSGFTEDCRKYMRASVLGWIVVRVTSDMVKSGEAVSAIEEILKC